MVAIRRPKPAKPVASAAREIGGSSSTALATRKPSTAERSADLLKAFFAKRSALTARNYRIDLVAFGRWWSEHVRAQPSLSDTAPADERDAFVSVVLQEFFAIDAIKALALALTWVQDMRSSTNGFAYSSSTVNHRISALRAVTDLAHTFGMCAFTLRKLDTLPSSKTRSTEGCGESGYDKLIAFAEAEATAATLPMHRFRTARDVVIVRLLHDAGLRRFESLQAQWPVDVDLDAGRLRFRGKKRADKEWFEVLDDPAIEAIRRYLQQRGEAPGYLVFSRNPDKSLNVSSVNRILTALTARAGVDVTPHGLRHRPQPRC